MIHDLDIILALVQAESTSIEAVGVPVLTDKFDIANARLRFADRLHRQRDREPDQQERVRKIRFFQPDAYMSIDYAEQEVEGYRLEAPRRAAAGDPGRQAAGRRARSRSSAS